MKTESEVKERVLKIKIVETQPLRWPEGLGRTLINDRQSRQSWNKAGLINKNGGRFSLKELP